MNHNDIPSYDIRLGGINTWINTVVTNNQDPLIYNPKNRIDAHNEPKYYNIIQYNRGYLYKDKYFTN
jgi:hypothetical protein